jgi:hypothetical protein
VLKRGLLFPIPIERQRGHPDVVGGELFGAEDVLAGGILYDVEFLDGTSIALYSGCDDVSDFTFQTQTDAEFASQALLDHVFLDGAYLFDFNPELTNGCSGSGGGVLCTAWTPYVILGTDVTAGGAGHSHVGRSDRSAPPLIREIEPPD